jgi:hypothetical protein
MAGGSGKAATPAGLGDLRDFTDENVPSDLTADLRVGLARRHVPSAFMRTQLILSLGKSR